MTVRVIITRQEDKAERWGKELVDAGIEVIPIPLTEFRAVNPQPPIELWERVHWITLTSETAVHRFFEWMNIHHLQIPKSVKLAAVGPTTGNTIQQYGYPVALQASIATGRELALELLRVHDSGELQTVLYPAGAVTAGQLSAVLQENGVKVIHLPLYSTQPRPTDLIQAELDQVGVYSAVLFAAPSSARVWREVVDDAWRKPCIAIGTTTAKALRELGCANPIVCDHTGPEAVLHAVKKALNQTV